jgi:WD40 repeat protein
MCVVQVWDIRRLERDVSFASRLTYAGQSGRITSVCPVLDGASVASASSSGSLHVWHVEYSSKPGGWAPDKYRGVTLHGWVALSMIGAMDSRCTRLQFVLVALGG